MVNPELGDYNRGVPRDGMSKYYVCYVVGSGLRSGGGIKMGEVVEAASIERAMDYVREHRNDLVRFVSVKQLSVRLEYKKWG